jgi:hypothetical protein
MNWTYLVSNSFYKGVREVKNKVLVIVLAVAMLALPMISAVQAYGWEKKPEDIYEVDVSGQIVPDSEVDFWETRKWQFGKYTAHSEKYGAPPGTEEFSIAWDDKELIGTEVLWVSYKIDLDSFDGDTFDGGKFCQGIVNFKVEITFEGGKFKGHMQWVGDLVLKPDNTVRLPIYYPPMGIFEEGIWAWHTYWQGTGAYAGWKITQAFGPALGGTKSILLIR